RRSRKGRGRARGGCALRAVLRRLAAGEPRRRADARGRLRARRAGAGHRARRGAHGHVAGTAGRLGRDALRLHRARHPGPRDLQRSRRGSPGRRRARPDRANLSMAAEERPRAPETLDEELLEAEVAEVLSTLDDQTRVQRIREEIEYGFDALAHVGAGVSVFGSARTPPDAPEYEAARSLARKLGEGGFAVITGGGPGIM